MTATAARFDVFSLEYYWFYSKLIPGGPNSPPRVGHPGRTAGSPSHETGRPGTQAKEKIVPALNCPKATTYNGMEF
ncbi:MAG: hypothetical protein V1816_23765 [Pseudomonadota bacterium]